MHFGRVYEAETLNPVQGILVGIHKNMDDTAFVRNPFLRIAKTDSAGGFRIGNIHPGKYRLYAVDDISRDYRLTIGEALAFMDQPIEVTAPGNRIGRAERSRYRHRAGQPLAAAGTEGRGTVVPVPVQRSAAEAVPAARVARRAA